MAKKHDEQSRSTARSLPTFLTSDRFWTITLGVLLLSIALFTAINLRLSTVDLKIADQWGEQNVRANILNQFANQIRAEYPTLPDASVQSEANKRYEQYYTQNKDAIDQQSKQLGQQLRAHFQYETGTVEKYNQTYVLEMDPYFYWYRSVNYANTGSQCDPGSALDEHGTCIDAHRLAPLGTPTTLDLHVVLQAFIINLIRAFNDNLDTLTIIFYTPVLLAALAVIPAFFLGRRVGGNIGGFVAAMIIAVHPILMNRTIAGFSDSDGYNFLFPLLIFWLTIEALQAKNKWSQTLLAAGAGIAVGLFSFAWSGWWFPFLIVIPGLIGYIVYSTIEPLRTKKKLSGVWANTQHPLLVLGTFFLLAAISVSLFHGIGYFVRSFIQPFLLNANLQAATSSGIIGWPNVLTTVAELNIPSIASILGNLGGAFLATLCLFGIYALQFDSKKTSWGVVGLLTGAFIYYYLVFSQATNLPAFAFIALLAIPFVLTAGYRIYTNTHFDAGIVILISLWFIAALYATTIGIRFLLFMIPPFAIGLGAAIGWIYRTLSNALTNEFNRPYLMRTLVALFLLLLIFNPVTANPYKQGKAAAQQQIPGMNDGWWEAVTYIRDNTPPDTIITSWWDFGHWFRNIGNRSVTFDGASQNPAPGHLVGKILLSPNETESVGILRMLDCGHNTAYEIAVQYMDIVPAKELIDALVVLNRADAIKYLQQTTLPADAQAALIEETHCTPPPAVFITSGDMVGKAGVWGHFGSWDFRKAVAYHYVQTLSQAEATAKIQALGYDEATAVQMYYTIRAFASEGEANAWIAPWPGYVTGWHGCSQTNSTVSCSINVGIQQTSQGTVVIENVVFNATAPQQAIVTFGVYGNGARLGGSSGLPIKVSYADHNATQIRTTERETADISMGVLIEKNGPTYRVLIADPLQVDSLFTQLYYLDGAFTPHFTKLIETSQIGGDRIVVWNVTWPDN